MTNSVERPFLAPSPADTADTDPIGMPLLRPESRDSALADPDNSDDSREPMPLGMLDMPAYHELSPQDIRAVFAENPTYDKGIGAVLDAVQNDFEARSNLGYLAHEESILALARSEAARARERDARQYYDLSVGDDELGFARELQQTQYQMATDNSLDEAAKTMHGHAAGVIGRFIERQESDGSEAAQASAATLYDMGKKHLDTYTSDSPVEAGQYAAEFAKLSNDVKSATLDLENEHGDYNVALTLIDQLVEMADDDDDERTAPTGERSRAVIEAELAAVEKEYGLLYAKREEKVLATDVLSRTSRGNKALELQHRELSRELFKLEKGEFLRDPSTTHADRLQALNQYIFDRGHALEEKKLESDGRSRFKKLIHKMGEKITKHPYITAIIAAPTALALSTVTAGAAAGLTAGMLAYVKAEHRHYTVKQGRERLFESAASSDTALDASAYEEFMGTQDYDEDAMDELFDHAMSQNRNKLEKRVVREQARRLGSIGIGLAVGGFGWLGAHHFGLDHLGGDNASAAPSGPSGDVPAPNAPAPVTPADAPHMPNVQVPHHNFAPDTFTVHHGDGFYDILKNMGVDPSQRDDVLAKATKELYQRGFAYRMADGLPGIPGTGHLSQGAIDILVKAAGK